MLFIPTTLPDHTQLPCEDGTFVKNFQEHPQSSLLTDSLEPILHKLHPDGNYAIGQDCGIYWRLIDPPERGAEAPDWFYVPDVPPMLNGEIRRSYVMWQEHIPPLLVLEFVSGDGSEERDQTPWKGKFWIYERVIRPAFYGIYEVQKAAFTLYELVGGNYQLIPANERGHYPVAPMGVELGIWQGVYFDQELPWLRWWDTQGNLLLTGREQSLVLQEQASILTTELSQETQARLLAQQRVQELTERLRALGLEP